MNVILLGAPGSGKGTNAKFMQEIYHLTQLSTGDIFRANIKSETELGKIAKTYIDKGSLVPDDITIKMMMKRLNEPDCKNGYVLDGYPRTLAQAEELDKELIKNHDKIDLVLLVDTPDDIIIGRICQRRVCEKCGKIYNMKNFPPKKEGICDVCGGNLIQRKDDTKEVVMERLNTYHKETQSLIDFYEKKGLLKTVPGYYKTDEETIAALDAVIKEVK